MDAFSCIACRSNQGSAMYLQARDYYLNKPFTADYWRCSQCSVVQQNPIPKETGHFYDAYPVHGKKSFVYRLMRRLVMGPVYFKIGGLRPGTRLLDYGCGDGSFLDESRRSGIELLGFEPNPGHAARLASDLGIPVFSRLESLFEKHEGQVDILTQHFVLEHVSDLHETFEIAKRLLKSGGLYYIVVPEIDSWESRLFGQAWHNLDAPRHVSFPNSHGVQLLAKEHGFRIAHQRRIPFPNGIAGSIPVILSGKFRFWLFLLSLPIGILSSRLAPGGTRAYWLEKA